MPGQELDPKDLKPHLEQQMEEIRRDKHMKQLQEKAVQRSANSSQKLAGLNAKADQEWAKVKEKAERMEIHGFDNVVSAMMSILEVAKILEAALRASRNSLFHEYVGSKFFDQMEGLYDQWRLKGEPDDYPLPTFKSNVEFNEENQLQLDSFIDNMTRSDGNELSEQEKGFIAETFKTKVLVDWLAQIGDGYEPVDITNPSTKIVSKIDGKEMSKAEFENYRDGKVPGVKGLNEFLSEAYDLKFESHNQEAPGMRMGR